MVEGLGVSQVFAFVPLYLREMGVAEPDRLALRRDLRVADLRRRRAARPALGRLGRQVQPEGRRRPERPRRGRRVRRGRPQPRAVAAGAAHAAGRVPARQHGGHAGGDPRRRVRSAGSARSIAVFGVSGPGRLRARTAARRVHRRRSRPPAVGDLLGVGRVVRRDGPARDVRQPRGPARGRPGGSRRRPGVRCGPGRPVGPGRPADLRDLRVVFLAIPGESAVHPRPGRDS